MRVRLAGSLDDGFLVLDEPTNDLDREGRDAFLAFLRDHSGGLLLISHDRDCLDVCDDVLELSNQGLAKFGGGWAAYVQMKAREREDMHRSLDVARRERDAARVDHAEKNARQNKRNRRGSAAAARGGMPKILLGARKSRAQASTGKVDALSLARANDAIREVHEALNELKIDPVMYADLAGQAIPAQKLVAEAQGFNIRRGRWIYAQDLDFSWRANVRVALQGGNGSASRRFSMPSWLVISKRAATLGAAISRLCTLTNAVRWSMKRKAFTKTSATSGARAKARSAPDSRGSCSPRTTFFKK